MKRAMPLPGKKAGSNNKIFKLMKALQLAYYGTTEMSMTEMLETNAGHQGLAYEAGGAVGRLIGNFIGGALLVTKIIFHL